MLGQLRRVQRRKRRAGKLRVCLPTVRRVVQVQAGLALNAHIGAIHTGPALRRLRDHCDDAVNRNLLEIDGGLPSAKYL
jgi:hypothetical protein